MLKPYHFGTLTPYHFGILTLRHFKEDEWGRGREIGRLVGGRRTLKFIAYIPTTHNIQHTNIATARLNRPWGRYSENSTITVIGIRKHSAVFLPKVVSLLDWSWRTTASLLHSKSPSGIGLRLNSVNVKLKSAKIEEKSHDLEISFFLL